MMAAENQEKATKKQFMQCMACGAPTVMTYRKRDIEAAFCSAHVTREEGQLQITIMIRNYF